MRHVHPPQAGFSPHTISPSGEFRADDERLTRLIGRIYDAALLPALWPETLAEIAAFVGGQAAGTFSKDSVSKDSIPYHHFGVDPKQVQIYSQTHSRLDPFSNLRLFDVGQVVSIPELVPYDEFRRGRFFLEWMEPQGWVDAANCVLEKSVLRCSFLTIIRSKEQGPVDDEMRERMALVVPHVRRAVPIGREMDVEQIRTAALTNVLDGLSAGMFLIAGDGTVMHANSAGQGMLVAEDCDMNAQVQQALTAAVQAGLGVDNLTLPVTAGNGDRYLIHVLPLSSGARRDAPVAHPTCAAVFVQKAVLDGLAPQVMARAFDLTPTELRVLLAIIEVGGIPQAASMLGVADSTVKTHVGRLFEKTGTCRQADLVKLAAGYCTPLLN